MIGYLQGKVIARYPETNQIVLQVHRMGFEITVPAALIDSLLANDKVTLWVHTHVREDILSLFGFSSEIERRFFKELIGVSGLGPKTAMALLSEHGGEKLIRLLAEKNHKEISSAPGVGKKLAERLVLELSNKIDKWVWTEKVSLNPVKRHEATLSPERQWREDLSSALTNLGYQPNHVKNTLERLAEKDDLELLGFETALKLALREMSARPMVAERPNG